MVRTDNRNLQTGNDRFVETCDALRKKSKAEEITKTSWEQYCSNTNREVKNIPGEKS